MLRLPSSDINSSRPKTQVSALRAGNLRHWLKGMRRQGGQWSGTATCCPLALQGKAGSPRLCPKVSLLKQLTVGTGARLGVNSGCALADGG